MPLWEGVVGAVVVCVCDTELVVYVLDSELISSIFLMVMACIGGGGSDSLDALDAPGG